MKRGLNKVGETLSVICYKVLFVPLRALGIVAIPKHWHEQQKRAEEESTHTLSRIKSEQALQCHRASTDPLLECVRSMIHNVPTYLNFETFEETMFAVDVLSHIRHINNRDKGFHFKVDNKLKSLYLNQQVAPWHAPVTGETFDKIEAGCFESALFLTEMIFARNGRHSFNPHFGLAQQQ
ncbi:hypothetical protein [Alteromonas macleodii]|uniref:Uncharacterized protein n=1 Tax=Alteromonas macleodii TaxID=28108 RepID=A0AB36FKV3_ALTMA|nr:hypothetical protein [Alteromonas macleodii]OES24161.1 hypothetical protein BFV93_4761 [Alteromonas macleodii]OES24795.1 hypothetical protein BFV95_4554 [Alteromonas macleodii]OES25073.1 hypothetical protein BFV94_4544 [Alteromonas macleodii]OES39116.1 hypothetical protein BFV96_4264 [Alteromonas macleodii]